MFDIRATKYLKNCCFSVVQSLIRVRLFESPWTAAHQASLSFTISWSLLRLMSSESVMPADHLILCRQLLLLPSIFPSFRVFSGELALCMRWPKCWSFSITLFSVNIQGWFPLGLTGLISSMSKGLSRVFSRTTVCFIKTFMGNWKQEDSAATKAVVLADLGNASWSRCWAVSAAEQLPWKASPDKGDAIWQKDAQEKRATAPW